MEHHQPSPGHYIREWRKYRGLTQSELAEAIAIHRCHLNKIERGHRYHARPVLEAIAAKLDCLPNDLIRRHPSHASDISEIEALYMSLSAEERRRAIDLLRLAFIR